MRGTVFSLLIVACLVTSILFPLWTNRADSAPISIEQAQIAAGRVAESRWVTVNLLEEKTLLRPNGEPSGYCFVFGRGEVNSINENAIQAGYSLRQSGKIEEGWELARAPQSYGYIVMSVDENHGPVLEMCEGLPFYKIFREDVKALAGATLDLDKIEINREFYLFPIEDWYEVTDGQKTIYVNVRRKRTADPIQFMTFKSLYDVVGNPTSPTYWSKLLTEKIVQSSDNSMWIPEVPNFNQTEPDNCGPHAAAQVLGYWDNHMMFNGSGPGSWPRLIDSDFGALEIELRDPSGWYPNCGGVQDYQLQSGIMTVCNNPQYHNNYDFSPQLYYGVILNYSVVRDALWQWRPGVVLVNNNQTYGDHFMTVVGFWDDVSQMIIVHDNWDPPWDEPLISWDATCVSYIDVQPGGWNYPTSGNQSGTWTLQNHPYCISGDITVPTGQTLTIEPGVDVVFRGDYKFTVNGTLQANGTEADSIYFTHYNPIVEPRWNGIRFINATNNCQISYSIIEAGNANGAFPDCYGGGIYCQNSDPTIEHSRITQNQALIYGGGIYCDQNSQPEIDSCIIQGNYSQTGGGGIYCAENSDPEITYCRISGNGVALLGTGGGIACRAGSNVSIKYCLITSNYATVGGGVMCDAANPTILNCTLSNNEADYSSGGLSCTMQANPVITNSIFWNNAGEISSSGSNPIINYCCIQGGWAGGTGIIDTDPLFVNVTNGDFHLQSTLGSYHNGSWLPDPGNSPCIDTGNPSSPYGNEPQPNGNRINLGIEGNTTEASLTATPGISGNVGGQTWTAAGNPYRIIGNINVPSGQTLTIQPGVMVVFQGYFKFTVNGTLLANGNANNYIQFTSADPIIGWRGIRLDNASDNCQFSYCIIERGRATGNWPDDSGGGIYCYSCNATFNHCIISENSASADGGGGGITCYYSNAHLENCTISNNSTTGGGGGMFCINSDLNISNCSFSGNTGYLGAGLLIHWLSDPIIEYCSFSNNIAMQSTVNNADSSFQEIITLVRNPNPPEPGLSAIKEKHKSKNDLRDNGGGCGGGINIQSSSNPIISHCVFSGNSTTNGWGGGICYYLNSNPNISNCEFYGNMAYIGGGIECENTSSSMINDCILTGNQATDTGGGIYCLSGANPTISNNTISANTAMNAGGIYCHSGANPSIVTNIIKENSASSSSGHGGGIYLNQASPSSITNNLITQNSANYGGGLCCNNASNAIITNNTFSGNTGTNGSAIAVLLNSSPVIKNCIIWGNNGVPSVFTSASVPSINYCDVQGGWSSGIGNLNESPLFVNASSGDYHLQSLNASYHNNQWQPDPNHSPCIDAGDPNSAFNNEPLPNGGRINMGFEGNTEEASLSPPISSPFTFTLPAGFSLISLPVEPASNSLAVLFPTATASCWEYLGGAGVYSLVNQLENGKAYWIEMTQADTVTITGAQFPGYSTPVTPPWEMLGAPYNAAVPVTSPPNGVAALWEFTPGGYDSIPSLLMSPGKGYWVNLDSGTTTFILGSPLFSGSPLAGLTPEQTLTPKSLFDQAWGVTLALQGDSGSIPNMLSLYIGGDDTVTFLAAPPAPPAYLTWGSLYNDAWTAGPYFSLNQPWQQADSLAWLLYVDPNGNVMPPIERSTKVSWDPVDFPEEGYFQILDEATGDIIIPDMRETDTLTVTGINERYYQIIWTSTPLGIGSAANQLPDHYLLEQNVPNPFNAAAQIRYFLLQAGRVELTVYNIRGQEVAKLVNSDQEMGYHTALFDASDLASGIYIYSIKVNEFKAIKKMVMVK